MFRYRGGLDVTNNQTGETSIYTEFKDRKIMFHVSTLLPHDQGDTQYVRALPHFQVLSADSPPCLYSSKQFQEVNVA